MRMTQRQMIKQHLLLCLSLTQAQAIAEYGCFRLSHVIYLLRKDGMAINSNWQSSTNRFGHPVHFVSYQLAKEQSI
jgi:hypothetical protein